MIKSLFLVMSIVTLASCSSSSGPGSSNGGNDTTLTVLSFSPDTAVRNVTVVTLSGKHFPTTAAATHLRVGGTGVSILEQTDTSIIFRATDTTVTGAVVLNGKQAPGILTVVSPQPSVLDQFVGMRATIDLEHTHLIDRQVITYDGTPPQITDMEYNELLATGSGKLVEQNGKLVFADSTNYGTAPATDWQATTGYVILDANASKIVEMFLHYSDRSNNLSQGSTSDSHMTVRLRNIPMQVVNNKITATLNGALLNDTNYVKYDRYSESHQPGTVITSTLHFWEATAPQTLTVLFQ
ncbi:MAG: hypothetical protein Q8922_01450 [Bacteroidota bacterium]|nr:hypothetical protein [Bacteroidota bacterium]MDP4232107.1 hypothetical protein [Bacteroidota bacterium]MDP4241185.1 hypothetical protein [Bacteroidota bacterium]MDP4286577.1 hypothetical protein [Bacteroidota bacterium]